MPLSDKAVTNILRLLNTEDERNGALAFRLLNSQKAADDFLLSLCGYFMTARGEQRLMLRNCLKTLMRVAIRERGCSAQEADGLLWLLNHDPEQKNANPEKYLANLEDILRLDVLALSRFLFSEGGHCGSFLLQRGSSSDREAILKSRIYNGPFGPTLDLSRLHLTQLPERASQFTNLQALDLSYNQLQGPDVFFLQPFRQLRCLNLASNPLKDIPDGLSLLPQLQEVDLRKNRIRLSLFRYLQHPLKEILKINLQMEDGFTLDQFDKQDVACVLKNFIYDVDGLQVLNLSGLKIRSIPEALQHYPQLAFIDLQNNPIGALPRWLLKMPCLREIYCDRGVEYNPAVRREDLEVFRDNSRSLPRPNKQAPLWLPNLSNYSASLPVVISVRNLDVR